MTTHPFEEGPNVTPPPSAAVGVERPTIIEQRDGYKVMRTATAEDMARQNAQLQFWHDEVVRLNLLVEYETADRATIKLSPQYIALEQQIALLTQQRDALIAHIPDSKPELEKAKESMMMQLRNEGLTKFRNIYAKMGKRQTVNVSRLLNVLGGDVGILLEMAKVTQKQLKEFAETMPQAKQEIMSCVDTEGVMKDLEIGFHFDSRGTS